MFTNLKRMRKKDRDDEESGSDRVASDIYWGGLEGSKERHVLVFQRSPARPYRYERRCKIEL